MDETFATLDQAERWLDDMHDARVREFLNDLTARGATAAERDEMARWCRERWVPHKIALLRRLQLRLRLEWILL